MKVTLKPGAELEILTQAELAATLTQALSGYARGPQTDRRNTSIKLSSAGASVVGSTAQAVPVYRVKMGYSFTLHRMTIRPDGYTFGVPYTSSTGYLEIQRAGILIDGIPLTAPGLPSILTTGFSDAAVFDNGETVDLLISGGPASGVVQVFVQGTLRPVTV